MCDCQLEKEELSTEVNLSVTAKNSGQMSIKELMIRDNLVLSLVLQDIIAKELILTLIENIVKKSRITILNLFHIYPPARCRYSCSSLFLLRISCAPQIKK